MSWPGWSFFSPCFLGMTLQCGREDAGDADQVAHLDARVAQGQLEALQLVAVLADALGEEAFLRHERFCHTSVGFSREGFGDGVGGRMRNVMHRVHPIPIPHPYIYMQNLGRGEAVEPGRRGVAVGADVLAVEQVAQVQVGQVLGQGDGVQGVAGRPEDRADLRRPALEGLQVVLAMVEDDAGEGVVDAVVDVVAAFAVADRRCR